MKRRTESLDQLLLDFETRHEALKVAAQGLDEIAGEIATFRSEPPSKHEPAPSGEQEMRRTLNRLAGVLSAQSGLPFAVVWVLAYHELHARTGFHAVAASNARGTYLDAAAAGGHLRTLQDVMLEMLSDPKFKAGGGR